MLLTREHATIANKAPIVRAMTALLMVITILAATLRIATRLTIVGSLSLDDGLVIASTVLAVIQSIIVIFEGSAGLGIRHRLHADQVSLILKNQYASDILFITVIYLAKISATRTMWNMAPRERKRLILITEAFISAWALCSILVTIFQCSLPKPWDYMYGTCFNRGIFWTVVDMLNIATDILITGILIDMFKSLQTPRSKKVLVIAAFGCRMLITPVIISHIYYLRRATELGNPIFDMWIPAVVVQIIQCLSILVTCVPFLKPLMDSLETGQMNAGEVLQTRIKGTNSKSQTGDTVGQRHFAPRTFRALSSLTSNASSRRRNYEMVEGYSWGNTWGDKQETGTTATVTVLPTRPRDTWDGQSHMSHSVLVQQTWHVEIETLSNAS
ncbi:hypothetical protein FAVG1_11419 [Fusarium avenaceum]|nr:hypothetical protein FAVG1_11419 [Fusarium avenaceum]